jgi:hypothetical protein
VAIPANWQEPRLRVVQFARSANTNGDEDGKRLLGFGVSQGA